MSNAKTMFCCNTALAGIMFQRNLNNLFSYPTAQHLKSQGIPCTTDFLARFAVVSRPTTATNQTNTRGFSFRQWTHRSSPLHFACKKSRPWRRKNGAKQRHYHLQTDNGRTEEQNRTQQNNRTETYSYRAHSEGGRCTCGMLDPSPPPSSERHWQPHERTKIKRAAHEAQEEHHRSSIT